jgi:Flp pilus assembly protein TadG
VKNFRYATQTIASRISKILTRMRATARAGSAAIEFAMIAPVFFMLLMGIMENGIIYFAGATLQNATDDVSRQIRTGQAQAAGMTQQQFRTAICNEIAPLLACDSNLQIDVESYNDYSTAGFAPPTDAAGNLKATLNNYVPGTACNVVLVRTFYTWKVITPMLSPFLTNITGGYHLVSATSAFRNEPFVSGVGGC